MWCEQGHVQCSCTICVHTPCTVVIFQSTLCRDVSHHLACIQYVTPFSENPQRVWMLRKLRGCVKRSAWCSLLYKYRVSCSQNNFTIPPLRAVQAVRAGKKAFMFRTLHSPSCLHLYELTRFSLHAVIRFQIPRPKLSYRQAHQDLMDWGAANENRLDRGKCSKEYRL